MSQKRFIDYGSTVDAGKVKTTNRQFFAPQVLRADEPFFSAVSPDQLLINPHGVIFDSGLVLVEDEIISRTITTGFSSANYTVWYEHVDEDIIGGVPATLKVTGGLLSTVENGVILGWIQYPGGSVPLSNSMLYPNWKGQVVGGQGFHEYGIHASNIIEAPVMAKTTAVTVNYGSGKTNQVIPGSQQISMAGLIVSKLLAPANQIFRVYCRDTGVDMDRVTGVPVAGEYNLDVPSEVVSFAAADIGKTVDLIDMTYGSNPRILDNTSPTDPGSVDTVVTFPVTSDPFGSLFVEYVILNGYTVDPVEILDAGGNSVDFTVSKSEPLDGRIARMTIRLIEGVFHGTAGEAFTARIRSTVDPSGHGIDLRFRASSYALPL